MQLSDAIKENLGEATVFITKGSRSYIFMNTKGELFPFWNDGITKLSLLEILCDIDSANNPYLAIDLESLAPEYHEVEIMLIKGFDTEQ